MHVQNPSQPFLLATDWRQRTDADLDFTEPQTAPHVLDLWRFAKEAVGPANYRRLTRVALFTPGDTPCVREAAAKRTAFVRLIEETKPRHVLVLPTPDAQLGEVPTALRGTHVWSALRAPDALDAMRGTWWSFNADTIVTPIFSAARRTKELQNWCNALWMKRVFKERTLIPYSAQIEPDEAMVRALQSMQGKSVAVDLEFIPNRGTVTALGLSDGRNNVSVPWHTFIPYGSKTQELGVFVKRVQRKGYAVKIVEQIAEILASPVTKYAHNFVADIPRLQAMGFTVNGHVHDTFAAHAIAFPELRHALQLAASHLLPCPPWKSLYKPRVEKYMSKDDEEYWTCDPKALRRYNARDAFYTWHLAQEVLPLVDVHASSGEKLEG